MDVSCTRTSLGEVGDDVLIVPVFEGETPLNSQDSPALAALDHLSGGAVERLAEYGELSGKLYSWSLLHNAGQLSARRVLFIGAGKREAANPVLLQRVSGAAVRALASRKVGSAAILLRNGMTDEPSVKAIIEGAILGQVTGDIYRTGGEETNELSSLHLIGESLDLPDLSRAIETATTNG